MCKTWMESLAPGCGLLQLLRTFGDLTSRWKITLCLSYEWKMFLVLKINGPPHIFFTVHVFHELAENLHAGNVLCMFNSFTCHLLFLFVLSIPNPLDQFLFFLSVFLIHFILFYL